MGFAEGLIPASALVKVAQVRFDNAKVVLGPVPETRETRTAVEGLFDFSTAIDAGNAAEKLNLNGISQEIIQRSLLIVQTEPIGDRFFVFMAERPNMTR